MFEPGNVSILMSRLSKAKPVATVFCFMICSHIACLVLGIVDSRLMSSLYRVLSPAQRSSLFINYTKDLLLVSNASVIPKAKCFPGEKFPEEQAYMTLASL